MMGGIIIAVFVFGYDVGRCCWWFVGIITVITIAIAIVVTNSVTMSLIHTGIFYAVASSFINLVYGAYNIGTGSSAGQPPR